MRFSLTRLRGIFGTNLTSEKIAELLIPLGPEVDRVHLLTPPFQGAVVVKIMSVHPLAKEDGCAAVVFDGKETLRVVCKAPNCRPNLMTILAPEGARLKNKDGDSIIVRKEIIHGEESAGKLLSEEDLGREEKSNALIELTDDHLPGSNPSAYFEDEILEISFTPNLGHCMSLRGLARELSPVLKLPCRFPEYPLIEGKEKIDSELRVSIEAKTACPFYACRLIDNVRVGSSPFWLKEELRRLGLKSVNNVVDVTNYVLAEIGQPLHAFDFDTLSSKHPTIRFLRPDEPFEMLDGQTKSIPEEMLFVCDGNRPIALAGVIGSRCSRVTEETSRVLLEAAYFDPKVIRKASRLLNVHTDASGLFEKGTDPNRIFEALDMAASLLSSFAGGTVRRGRVYRQSREFSDKMLSCRIPFINRLLGTRFTAEHVVRIFNDLNFHPVLQEDGHTIVLKIPFFRHDLCREVDLVEEIVRMTGFDALLKKLPEAAPSSLPDDPLYRSGKKVLDILRREGLREIITGDLISPDMARLSEKGKGSIAPLNFVSREHSVLRSSLLPGHLRVIRHNLDRQTEDLSLFEIGKVYYRTEEFPYRETTDIAVSLTGRKNPYHWQEKESPCDFFHLKGITENLFASLHMEKDIIYQRSNLPFLHPYAQAAIFYREQPIGSIGEVHPSFLRNMQIKNPVFFAEISLPALTASTDEEIRMKPVPLYPRSERDWTVCVSEETETGHLMRLAKSKTSDLLKEVYLLDIYRSDKIGPDRKNVTLRFVYRNDKKTISFESVELEHAKIIAEISESMKNLILQPPSI